MKKTALIAILITLTLLAPLYACLNINSTAEAAAVRTINFSGYTWYVENTSPTSPTRTQLLVQQPPKRLGRRKRLPPPKNHLQQRQMVLRRINLHTNLWIRHIRLLPRQQNG